MYFDTSYIAKFYFTETGSIEVRRLVRTADSIRSSVLAIAEFHSVIHRHIRERAISARDARDVSLRFFRHIEDGLWNLTPVTEALLKRAGSLLISAPADLFIRSADAIHLTTAREIGERDVWTNDRHILAAAGYFDVTGRSVPPD